MFIQFLLVATILVGIVLTLRRAQQGAIRRIEAIGWTILWSLALVIVLRPQTSSAIANLVGVGRGSDLALYVSVLALFFLVFHLHVLHDRSERTITELIRREALRQLPEIKTRFEEKKGAHGTIRLVKEDHP